jgi:hypothetical protein
MEEGKYIYCIIHDGNTLDFGPIGIGGRGDTVYTVGFHDLGAVVSNSPLKKYSASRANFIAHERAIEAVMQRYTVLPVRFSTIADNEHTLTQILTREYEAFVRLLDQMQDKKELGLKAIFKEEVIYQHILKKYDAIRALKEKIASWPAAKAYYQQIEIGKMVESALQNEKENYNNEFLETLTPLAVDVKTNAPYGERMILNAAFLVEKQREPEFDQAVNTLADHYEETIMFKYVGTLPPFNFVNLVIETKGYGDVSH